MNGPKILPYLQYIYTYNVYPFLKIKLEAKALHNSIEKP